MQQRDSVVLCTQLRSFDREKKQEAVLNIAWVPYIISETVMSELNKFVDRGAAKTFAMVAINDNKVSVEEAV